MTPKTAALVLLGAVSLVCPLVEMAVTGQVDPLSPYSLAGTFLSLLLIFFWYHLDKQGRNYRAGRWMNAGMLVAVAIALPVYLIRSRGWKAGARSSLLALVVFGVMLALEELGERIGAYFH